MDNWFIFQYYLLSELQGRRRIGNPRNGILGQAQSRIFQENPEDEDEV